MIDETQTDDAESPVAGTALNQPMKHKFEGKHWHLKANLQIGWRAAYLRGEDIELEGDCFSVAVDGSEKSWCFPLGDEHHVAEMLHALERAHEIKQ